MYPSSGTLGWFVAVDFKEHDRDSDRAMKLKHRKEDVQTS